MDIVKWLKKLGGSQVLHTDFITDNILLQLNEHSPQLRAYNSDFGNGIQQSERKSALFVYEIRSESERFSDSYIKCAPEMLYNIQSADQKKRHLQPELHAHGHWKTN